VAGRAPEIRRPRGGPVRPGRAPRRGPDRAVCPALLDAASVTCRSAGLPATGSG